MGGEGANTLSREGANGDEGGMGYMARCQGGERNAPALYALVQVVRGYE